MTGYSGMDSILKSISNVGIPQTNKITCGDCKFGIDVDINGRIKLCNNPNLLTYCKNVKHEENFSCGHGVLWEMLSNV